MMPQTQKNGGQERSADQPPDHKCPESRPHGPESHDARHADGEIDKFREDRQDEQGDEDLETDLLEPRDCGVDERIDQDYDGPRQAEEDRAGAEQEHK